MNFGRDTDEKSSFAILDRALQEGVNFWDTADVYGGVAGEGVTENLLGRYFAQGDRRERVVLATKVFGPMEKKDQPDPNFARGLSARKILQCCEASLRRMQTDWIDLFQMHHIDRDVSWDEIWQAFEVLTAQQKIIYPGSSNFAGWDIATACQEARRRNFIGLVSEQSLYNLSVRSLELEVIPACQHYGLALIPWSPLGGGMLAGKGEGVRRERQHIKDNTQRKADQIARYEELCKQIGHPPAEVGLAWLLHQPGVTAPIIGPRTMEQFESALRAAELKLDAETLQKLDEIWPGPGGDAPRAYAW